MAFQFNVDGGIGGLLKETGGFMLEQAGAGLRAEKQTDMRGQEDIAGAPTAPQKAAAGDLSVALGDARTMMLAGGALLGVVTLYLIFSK